MEGLQSNKMKMAKHKYQFIINNIYFPRECRVQCAEDTHKLKHGILIRNQFVSISYSGVCIVTGLSLEYMVV